MRAKTVADYAVMGVAPLLIVLMISSLANFLALILYHGPYPDRVAWTLLMFTLGAVGIARVAIEQDRAYSFGYAAVLGLVTLVTMIQFVGSPIFSAFTLVLIGYLADRIVHDCTLIDESVDASGEGLLDRGGRSSERAGTAGARRQGGKPHQPGRTVLYLSLAALPLFGLGQFFLRGHGSDGARAQWLLGVYLFAGLSLLVTTSFLGLRRYLRQREAEMPTNVSVAWLAGGGLMVALVVGAAMLAPLPGQAAASLQLPEWLAAPERLSASRFGWGDEGAEESSPDAAQTAGDPQQASKEPGGTRPESGAAPGDVGSGQRQSGPAGDQSGGQQTPSGDAGSDSSSSESGPSSSDPGSSSSDSGSSSSGTGETAGESSERTGSEASEQSGSEASGESASRSGGERSEPPAGRDSADSSENAAGESEPAGNEPAQREPGQSEPGQSESGAAEAGEPPERPADGDGQRRAERPAEDSSGASAARQPAASGLPSLTGLARGLLMLVLAAIVLGFLWYYREAILQWWQDLLGRSPVQQSAAAVEPAAPAVSAAPPRPFASFRNPFGAETDPRRAVVVTFQAFEAWSRERGWQRGKEETPSEFIRRVARSMPEMSTLTSQLVDAYNRIVYGRGQATSTDLEAASQLWQAMQRG